MKPLFDSIDIERPCTSNEVDAAERALNFKLPPSYREFCMAYGPGLIGGHFSLFTPMPDPDDRLAITVLGPLHDERFREGLAWYAQEGFSIGHDVFEGVDIEVLSRARFFGRSYNGESLFWDVRPDADEHDIYVLGYDGSTVRSGGRTVDAFIRDTQTEKVKAIFGTGYGPLRRTFKRFTPRPE